MCEMEELPYRLPCGGVDWDAVRMDECDGELLIENDRDRSGETDGNRELAEQLGRPCLWINDHGNVSLHVGGREVWGIV